VGEDAPAPAVSVVIPAYEDAADLPAAVAAVLGQDVDGGLEVIVAVAPSSDGTEDVARELAASDDRVRVVPNPARRTSSGLNAAIAACRAPVVARVDSHAVIPVGYLARAVAELRRTGAANVGGIQDPRGRSMTERAIACAMRSRVGSGGARYREGGPGGPVDTVYLGVFDRDALDAVGGFDESLERNQDYELNWRLRAAGRQVWFDPALRVGYRPRDSLRRLARQYADYGRWKCEVVRRHPDSMRGRQLLPPAVTATLLAAVGVAPFRRRALVVPAMYAAAVALGSASAARDEPISVRARVPIAVAVMHLAWGSAFLVELVTRSLRRGRRA
jgi:succinoglycan biosynthesis protein ExoA